MLKKITTKTLIIGIHLCLGFMVFSQTTNQLDANGKRHGIWKKNFEGTEVLRYEGEFLHGKETGLFKFYKNIKGKPVLTATKLFSPDTDIAEVKFLASNGKTISQGNMQGKTYIGAWAYYQKDSNALLTIEHYDNSGNLSGERTVYYPNGKIAETQHYKNGKLNGQSMLYSKENVLISELSYIEGKLEGIAKQYSAKGELTAEGQYKNDKKSGLWKFYENGKLKEQKEF
ncbi:MAG: toxin-antitoxin system YwqK family antitoxin [Flavobacteriaceae bacterium]